jgi:CRISPR-associated protein Csm5
MNRYRLTVLTPLLAGDGQKMSPIDYMVWKDQVNVLDQRRIFQLLAKGPRLDTYLNQIRKAEKLDFASWGGYAQNYASRRIPFEHPSAAQYYARTSPEHLFIPTFAVTPGGGIYVPGSALKGPLRTALLMEKASAGQWAQLGAKIEASERPPRQPALALEAMALGSGAATRTRSLLIGDSAPLPPGGATRIYLLRISTILDRGKRLELGWKMSPRGAVESRRPTDSTPHFAEMATPGTVFEGSFGESEALSNPEMLRALRWKEPCGWRQTAEAANAAAGKLLEVQRRYAEATGLALVAESIGRLETRLKALKEDGRGCLVCFGWGTGLPAKAAGADAGTDPLRQILRALPVYSPVLRTGLPFPKTRRIVFLNDQPAALPGWAELTFRKD